MWIFFSECNFFLEFLKCMYLIKSKCVIYIFVYIYFLFLKFYIYFTVVVEVCGKNGDNDF